MFCPKCGAPLKAGARFCSKCGYSIPASQTPPGMPGGIGQAPSGMPGGIGQAPSGMPGGIGQAPPPKKKKSKTWLIVLLSIVLLLVIACVGGGIFYYLNEKNNEAMLESIRSEYSDDEEDGEDDENEKEDDEEEDQDGRREPSEAEEDELTEANEETEAVTAAAAATIVATEAATMPATAAAAPSIAEPVTASVQYSSQVSFNGMVRAGVQKATAFDSSHVVQRDSTIDNSAWSAFDGQATTSWQEGAQGDGIGEYVGISFDREYQVQVITLLLGNHRSDSWYIKNNTPKTLTINLGGQVFSASFPKEKTEFAVVLSQPVAASDIRLTIDDVYKGTEYEDAIIAEVGVYGN